jgi:predicted RNA methylase
LIEVLEAEVRARLGEGGGLDAAPPVRRGPKGREDALALRVSAHGRAGLHDLRTAVAVQRVRRFAVPRPKALLGDAVLRELQAELREVVADAAAAKAPFAALRLEAAGRDSPVMRRLAEALATGVGLPEDNEGGDLVVRVRPDGDGWAVLIRTTRRPLSARAWRVCDRPGGLNATVAAAMPWLARPGRGVAALNAFAGSGTMAIELALADPTARVDGVDVDPEAVACAERNASAAGVEGRVRFAVGEATALAAADASVALLLADPPWGDAIGDHAANRALHPAFLAEAARVLRGGGRLALVTHEVALLHEVLDDAAGGRGPWRVVHERSVWHGGHHPRLVVLERVARGGRGGGGGARGPRAGRVLT